MFQFTDLIVTISVPEWLTNGLSESDLQTLELQTLKTEELDKQSGPFLPGRARSSVRDGPDDPNPVLAASKTQAPSGT